MTNLQIVQKMFMDFSKGDLPAVFASMTDDIVYIEPGAPDIPFGGTFKGKAGVQEMFGIEHQTIKLLTFHPLTFIAQNDLVVVLGNDSAQVLATQKTYYTEFAMVFWVENSLIKQVQVYMDTLAIAKAFSS